MEKIILFLTVLCCALSSCTKEKTDYEAEIDTIVPERIEFKEVTNFKSGSYTIHIEALGGQLYKGYNQIRLKIEAPDQPAPSTVTLLPILTDSQGKISSCPHRYEQSYQAEEGYFEGYVVFTEESRNTSHWDLHIGFTAAEQLHSNS